MKKQTDTKTMAMFLVLAMIISSIFIASKTIETPFAAPTECNHNWVKQTDKGHYEYQTLIGAFCGCNAGPFSEASLGKHVKDIAKQYGSKEALNHSGWRSDGTKITVLQWVVDTSYKCSICGATKTDEKTDNNNSVSPSMVFPVGSGNYKVTSTAKRTVQYTGTTSGTKPSANIPNTIKINGVTFKVTSIAPNALKYHDELKKVTIGKYVSKIGKKSFYGCKNLKIITIKTKKLTSKSIGANAFKGIHKKAKIKVPKGMKKSYKKILKKKGVNGKKQVIK